jgi:sensor histidine kinase YesM
MQQLAVQAALALLINTLIAAFLTAIGVGDGDFAVNLIFSYCIGFSIFIPCMAAIRLARGRRGMIAGVAASVVLGSVAGVALGMTLTGHGLEQWSSGHALQALLIGLMFGVGVSYLFYSRERMDRLEGELKERALREALAEQGRLDAQLRMLQAQIEPHFLFNTLANLSVLVRSDPARAERLLADLIAWLRATLQRTRKADSTLGDEVELLRRYLDILGLRLGDRLRVAFDVPEALLARPFPLLLLQPLVENAITHGIEPKLGGGELRIAASAGNGRLRLVVSDTGAGLGEGKSGTGFGLDNVRARLRALYGEAAALDVRENSGGGVTAAIELPA